MEKRTRGRPAKATASKPSVSEKPSQSHPKRVPLANFTLKNCSVRLQTLSQSVIDASTSKVAAAEENVYDFEESQSQEETINDDMKQVIHELEEKSIVKVVKAKRKGAEPKIAKKLAKPKTTASTTPKKRKATKIATKEAAPEKKRKAHNLSIDADNDMQNGVGANLIVTDNNTDGPTNDENDDTFSMHSVCSDIVNQDGEIIGMIEKEWSEMETRTLRKRKANATNSSVPSKVTNRPGTARVIDSIEEVDEEPAPPDVPYEPPADVLQFLDGTPQAEVPKTTRTLGTRTRSRKQVQQSTPITTRNRLNNSDIFNNASPLQQHRSIVFDAPPELFTTNEENTENAINASVFDDKPSSSPSLRVYGRSPLKNISNPLNRSDLFDLQKSTASDVRLDNRDRMKSGHVPLQSQSVVTAAPENAFGFDDDLTVFEPPRAVEPRPETHERKSLLAEKRQKLKQFLKNPKGTAKPAKAKATKKVISPAENVTKQDELFGEPSKAQKDIRSAFESHKSNEPTAEVPNLFGDTATEKIQDRRKSYTRKTKQIKRQLVADLEHEDEEEEEEEEVATEPEIVNRKGYKGKKGKGKQPKVVDPEEKSAEEEELNSFIKDINEHFNEIDDFEPVTEAE